MIQVRGKVRRGRELVLAARPLLTLACYRSEGPSKSFTLLIHLKFCLDKGESLTPTVVAASRRSERSAGRGGTLHSETARVQDCRSNESIHT